MTNCATLELNIRSLPILIELKGENGECELYEIKPAGRKFGAMLNKVGNVKQSMKRLFLSSK
jgi:hypothetical protein